MYTAASRTLINAYCGDAVDVSVRVRDAKIRSLVMADAGADATAILAQIRALFEVDGALKALDKKPSGVEPPKPSVKRLPSRQLSLDRPSQLSLNRMPRSRQPSLERLGSSKEPLKQKKKTLDRSAPLGAIQEGE